jgi:Uma2 family endonuclease
LAYDRDLKLPLYATAGVREVWLVDLTNNQVLVHRDPSGTNYRGISTVGRDGTLSPTAFPDLRLSVAELLPE